MYAGGLALIGVFGEIPSCAVAVFAHPDDAEIACGATLAMWASRGTRVILVVATTGDKGSILAGARSLADVRSGEVVMSAEVLGISEVVQLALGDGEVENTATLRRKLVSLVRHYRPEVVVCPDPTAVFFGDSYYNHRDHRQLGWACLDSVFPAAAQEGYFGDAGPVHRVAHVLCAATLEPTCAVQVGEMVERKISAVAVHRSQVEALGEMVGDTIRLRLQDGARQAGTRDPAELFRLVEGG